MSVRKAIFAPFDIRGKRHIGTARQVAPGKDYDYVVFTALCGWYAPEWNVTENVGSARVCRRCQHLSGGAT